MVICPSVSLSLSLVIRNEPLLQSSRVPWSCGLLPRARFFYRQPKMLVVGKGWVCFLPVLFLNGGLAFLLPVPVNSSILPKWHVHDVTGVSYPIWTLSKSFQRDTAEVLRSGALAVDKLLLTQVCYFGESGESKNQEAERQGLGDSPRIKLWNMGSNSKT